MNSSQSNTTSAPKPNGYTPTHQTLPGCGSSLDPSFSFLCDMEAAWGIVVETLAALGLLVTLGLLFATIAWTTWTSLRHRPLMAAAGTVTSLLLFLVGTAGMFSLTFAFVVRLGLATCPTRVFLFGGLSALCFSALVSRSLALRGLVRGWAELGLTLALSSVQAVVAAEWLLTVLVRDQQPCRYSQAEFVVLLIYVLCLISAALCSSVSCLCFFGCPRKEARNRAGAQALLLCLTVMLSMAIWVVWITLLTWGNWEMGRRPLWDDPVLSVALVSNAWVLLLGHGLAQAAFLRQMFRSGEETPLDFTGWTSPSGEMAGLQGVKKAGRENRSFESDSQDWRGKRNNAAIRSPYESGFSMSDIDPGKDYSIPRPQTTNTDVPYDDYYGRRLSN
ncbi:retinoic acid-induced protein 3 [Brienomyrus brachyistius]|uniref:retinoic acid-induced protein 3 n=1 Tax=Brienomyrus brachyistius TaxID=42636 RepID=UPI0020B21821|nr:retinoic acid-induced protein 3 [Brienomyrus brachyistius]